MKLDCRSLEVVIEGLLIKKHTVRDSVREYKVTDSVAIGEVLDYLNPLDSFLP